MTPWHLDPGFHRLSLGREQAAPVEVAVVQGRRPGPRLLFTAGIHGDEYEGIRALGELAQELAEQDLQGTVTLVPVANPEAFVAATRTSPLDGGNLNRSFPGNPQGTPTQRLAHLLMTEVLAGADLLVDLHAGGTRYAFETLVGFREWDGPVGPATYRAAWAFGVPNLWVMNPNPGVFSYEVCRAGVPALGVETTGTGGARPADIAVLKQGLYRVLSAWGALPPRSEMQPQRPQRVLRGSWTFASATGLFRAHVSLGDEVAEGALLAEVLDAWSRPLAEIRAGGPGRVAAICHAGRISSGDWAVWLMESAPAPEPGGIA
jgi:uncharacterized protein